MSDKHWFVASANKNRCPNGPRPGCHPVAGPLSWVSYKTFFRASVTTTIPKSTLSTVPLSLLVVMQWTMLSRPAAIVSLFLLFVGDLVVSQIDAPICTDFESWEWSFNSLGQNPCLVSAYLMATCYGGAFTVNPLLGVGDWYWSPTKEEAHKANFCWCNTVIFSLVTACSGCQEGLSRSWTEYSRNCTGTLEPSTFPNPVPVGTRVPQWTLLDVTRTNLWDATAARSVGDTPEILPGALIGTSVSSSVSPTSSTVSSLPASASPVSTTSGSGPNAGAIAGGVAGGVIAMAAVAGLVFSVWRKRRHAQEPSAAFVVKDAPPSPSSSEMGQAPPAPSYRPIVVPQTSQVHPAPSYEPVHMAAGSQVHTVPSYGHMPVPQTVPNDLNNTTTYPQHQGTTASTPPVHVSYTWYLGANDPANMQPLRPQGDHGPPTA
ncbi:hypothetical protein EDB87DRAFT_1361206 [Lactarius vividus]|nr:hypothetical protein EDB87DRAFT_1361206 [Lactarius vividus]